MSRVADGCGLCAAPQPGRPKCEGHFIVRVVKHRDGYYTGHAMNAGVYAPTYGPRAEAILFAGRRARRDAELVAKGFKHRDTTPVVEEVTGV